MSSATPDVVPVLKIRQRIDAASGSIRMLKRIDRLAAVLISLGGVGIVVSVFGILLFAQLVIEPPLVVGLRMHDDGRAVVRWPIAPATALHRRSEARLMSAIT